jgi:hypothetical protein
MMIAAAPKYPPAARNNNSAATKPVYLPNIPNAPTPQMLYVRYVTQKLYYI